MDARELDARERGTLLVWAATHGLSVEPVGHGPGWTVAHGEDLLLRHRWEVVEAFLCGCVYALEHLSSE